MGCKGRSLLPSMEVTGNPIPGSHCGQAELYQMQCSPSSPSFSCHACRDDLNYTLNISLGSGPISAAFPPRFSTTLTHIICKTYTAGVFSQVIPIEREGHLDILLQPTRQCFCEWVYVQEALGRDVEGLQVMVSVRITEVRFPRCVCEILQCEPSLRGSQRHTEIKSFMLQCFVRMSSAWFGKGCCLVPSCWLCTGRAVWGPQNWAGRGAAGQEGGAQAELKDSNFPVCRGGIYLQRY